MTDVRTRKQGLIPLSHFQIVNVIIHQHQARAKRKVIITPLPMSPSRRVPAVMCSGPACSFLDEERSPFRGRGRRIVTV